jgi:hypothetical protein
MPFATSRRPWFEACEETPMNRIERLMWEETRLSAIRRLERESRRPIGAKVISVMFLVGVMALLANRVPIAPVYEAVVPAQVAVMKPAREIAPSAAAPSRDIEDSAASAVRQDDPPAARY